MKIWPSSGPSEELSFDNRFKGERKNWDPFLSTATKRHLGLTDLRAPRKSAMKVYKECIKSIYCFDFYINGLVIVAAYTQTIDAFEEGITIKIVLKNEKGKGKKGEQMKSGQWTFNNVPASIVHFVHFHSLYTFPKRYHAQASFFPFFSILRRSNWFEATLMNKN